MKLPSLKGVHVLVVGDVMLDRYWSGPAHRVSQEAPVPVVHVTKVDEYPGGAANVALNVASLGAACTLVGVVGADSAGASMVATLSAAGVVCDLVEIRDWPTIVKQRVVSQQQQVMRADFEQPLPAEVDVAAAVLDKVRARLAGISALVLQDYDKGALADPESLISQARSAGVAVVVDPKQKPLGRYAGASLVKPNTQELQAVIGPWADDGELVAGMLHLCKTHHLGAVVVTRGSQGMTVVADDGRHLHIPALPVEVYDVTGAGDTAAAALGITTGLHWDALAGAQLANLASGIVVSKSGTAAVTGPELAMASARLNRADRGRLNTSQLVDAVAQARAAGQRIVFTNGCFDILHAGHVAYLEEARALGDRLIVAVNDDLSVRRLKGPGRPVNPLDRRLKVLSALAAVDWVVGFSEDTPETLLELLRPDVLAKGGDYAEAQVVGAALVREYGGDVRVLSRVEDCSTTAILERIQQEG